MLNDHRLLLPREHRECGRAEAPSRRSSAILDVSDQGLKETRLVTKDPYVNVFA